MTSLNLLPFLLIAQLSIWKEDQNVKEKVFLEFVSKFINAYMLG